MLDTLSLIEKYFRLPEKIKELTAKKKMIDHAFYLQNMATRTDYGELGIQAKAFKVEKMVIEHQMALEVIDKQLERNLVRCDYFIKYLNSLSQIDRQSLYKRFRYSHDVKIDEGLEDGVLDEINEIEVCICLREGIEVPETLPRIELTEDFDNNLTMLGDLFAI